MIVVVCAELNRQEEEFNNTSATKCRELDSYFGSSHVSTYLNSQWISCGELWSSFGRSFNHENSETNNKAERFFLTIKYQFLKGNANRRIDQLLQLLCGDVQKYYCMRFGNTWRRKKWVFGMMEVEDKRWRLVQKQSRYHLVPLIRKHVKAESSIISDEWRAYKVVLRNMGYKHYTTNHSKWFVDPRSGSHTQHIERAWGIIKGHIYRLKANRTETLLKEHLKVLEWSSWLGSRHPDGPLGHLF
ncbi:uncharacterized protein LOC134316991 [Trichomycterus rosablanca]|uniref:uncharacterized protein LOC134316991 n=1 Tax=Trichomycterus rosablanca TaxID=2290929 RepID=UPI002F351AEB